MREKTKRERLEAEGWKIGTVAEFLMLTPEESAMVKIESAPEGTVRKADISYRDDSVIIM